MAPFRYVYFHWHCCWQTEWTNTILQMNNSNKKKHQANQFTIVFKIQCVKLYWICAGERNEKKINGISRIRLRWYFLAKLCETIYFVVAVDFCICYVWTNESMMKLLHIQQFLLWHFFSFFLYQIKNVHIKMSNDVSINDKLAKKKNNQWRERKREWDDILLFVCIYWWMDRNGPTEKNVTFYFCA